MKIIPVKRLLALSVVLIIGFSGCGRSSPDSAGVRNNTPVTFNFRLPSRIDTKSKSFAPAPSFVATIEIEATDNGGTVLASIIVDAVPERQTVTFDVPSGSDRTLTVTAFDSDGNETFQGKASVDLNGDPVSVSIQMISTDLKLPVVTAPAPITASAKNAAGRPASDPLIQRFLNDVTAFDDAGNAIVNITNNAPDTFPIGVTTVIFSATDTAGEIGTKASTVTVRDESAPDITGVPDSIRVPAAGVDGTSSTHLTIANFLNSPTANDLVDGVIEVKNDAPATFPVGSMIVTFSATDVAGNKSSHTSVVTVTNEESPVVTPPASIIVPAVDAAGTPMNAVIEAFLSAATAIDDIDGNIPNPTITNDAPTLFPIGSTKVIFSATDTAGNTGIASSIITVRDERAPDVTAPTPIIVAALNAAGSPSDDLGIKTFLSEVTASDNVDGVIADITNNAKTIFPLGMTTVIFSAMDAAGNTGIDTSSVTVEDQTAPVISAPSAPLTLPATSVAGKPIDAVIQAFLESARAQDNVDGLNLPVTNDAPVTFPVGTTTVTFNKTDAAGNVATPHTSTVTITVAEVLRTNPENDLTGVSVDSAIVVTFSVPLDPAAMTTTTFTLNDGTSDVAGTVRLDTSLTTATFTPSTHLTVLTPYTVTIRTGAGLSANHVSHFTTAATSDLTSNVLIGGWLAGTAGTTEMTILTFIDEKNYMMAQDGAPNPGPVQGTERGTYRWDIATGALTASAISETNGDAGLGDLGDPGSVLPFTVSVSGDNMTVRASDGQTTPFRKIVPTSNPIVGSWLVTHGTTDIAIFTFIDDTNYMLAEDGVDPVTPGFERGTYTLNTDTGTFSAVAIADTNGLGGFSNPVGTTTVSISGDTATYADSIAGSFTAKRIVGESTTTSLRVHVLGHVKPDNPFPGVRILRHRLSTDNPDPLGFIEERTTNVIGIADFGDIGTTRTTISIVGENSKNLDSRVDIPTGTIFLTGFREELPDLADIQVNITGIPASASTAEVAIGAFGDADSSSGNVLHEFSTVSLNLKKTAQDGTFSLHAYTENTAETITSCGFSEGLLPSTIEAGNFFIDGSQLPTLIPFISNIPMEPGEVSFLRGSSVFEIGQNIPAPTTRGHFHVCEDPGITRYGLLGFRSPDPTNPTVLATGVNLSPPLPIQGSPLNFTIPDLTIDTLSRDSVTETVNWRLSGTDTPLMDIAILEMNWSGVSGESHFDVSRDITFDPSRTSISLPGLPPDLQAQFDPPATGVGFELTFLGTDAATGYDHFVDQGNLNDGRFAEVLFGSSKNLLLAERFEGFVKVEVNATSMAGGSVVSIPPGIDTASGKLSATFGSGTEIKLIATPDAGSTLSSFTIPGNNVTGDPGVSQTGTFTLTDFRTDVRLAFEPLVLTVGSTFGFGSVDSSPPGINCGNDCTEIYDNGTVVTLTPFPPPSIGSVFAGWRGNPDCADGRVTMTEPKTCNPVFFRDIDSDGDGLPDDLESSLFLNPFSRDSDGDGIPDGEEDFDRDGLSNQEEIFNITDPTNDDSDGDGILDGRDAQVGSDPLVPETVSTPPKVTLTFPEEGSTLFEGQSIIIRAEVVDNGTLDSVDITVNDVSLFLQEPAAFGTGVASPPSLIDDDVSGKRIEHRFIVPFGSPPTLTFHVTARDDAGNVGISLGVSVSVGTDPLPCTTAAECVSLGRTRYFSQALDVVGADRAFVKALELDPLHQEANLFRTFSRLLRVIQENRDGEDLTTFTDSFKEMLDRTGVTSEGRNIFNWFAGAPVDILGRLLLPVDSPTGAELQIFMETVLIPELRGMIENLTNIDCGLSSTFETTLTPEELQATFPEELVFNAVDIDCGDILMTHAIMKVFLGNLLIEQSISLDLDIDHLVAKGQTTQKFSINEFEANPGFLTPTFNASALLFDAKNMLISAIDLYNEGSTFIRSETGSQTRDLIVIEPFDLVEEQTFRNRLSEVRNNLNGTPTIVGKHTNQNPEKIDLSRLFTLPADVIGGMRDLLPEIDQNGRVISGTFPDPTFNGILPDMTQSRLLQTLKIQPDLVLENLSTVDNGDGSFTSFLNIRNDCDCREAVSINNMTLSTVATSVIFSPPLSSIQGVPIFSQDNFLSGTTFISLSIKYTLASPTATVTLTTVSDNPDTAQKTNALIAKLSITNNSAATVNITSTDRFTPTSTCLPGVTCDLAILSGSLQDVTLSANSLSGTIPGVFSSGTGSAMDCSTSTCRFSIFEDSAITVSPALLSFTVTVTVIPGQGINDHVFTDGIAPCPPDCQVSYATNSHVTLTSLDSSLFGNRSVGFTGDCVTEPFDASCEFFITTDSAVTADFNIQNTDPMRFLSVNLAGTQRGQVTIFQDSPPTDGQRCPSNCFASVPSNTVIKLEATPDLGHTFLGFSLGQGDLVTCNGAGPCTFTITTNSSISAKFD